MDERLVINVRQSPFHPMMKLWKSFLNTTNHVIRRNVRRNNDNRAHENVINKTTDPIPSHDPIENDFQTTTSLNLEILVFNQFFRILYKTVYLCIYISEYSIAV